jgi:hypothetical protein
MEAGMAKFWSAVWEFIIHPLTLFLAGIILSIIVGYYFYDRGKADAIAQALDEGRRVGLAQGLKDSQDAFDKNESSLLEKRYPGAIRQAKESGHSEGRESGMVIGHEEGRKEGYAAGEQSGLVRGHDAGYAEGVKSGRDAAARELSLQSQAEKNWNNYAAAVNSVGSLAESRKEGEERLIASSRALVDAAEQLKGAYADQAAAFNSIMSDLNAAVAARNVEVIRSTARALRANLNIKRDLFLQANQRIVRAFDGLRG